MFAALLPMLLPAFLPSLAEGLSSIINKITGKVGAQPANVAEAIQLMDAESRKLEVIAKLDMPTGNISKWVADLRASFRYLLAGFFIFATFVLLLSMGAGMNVDRDLVNTLLQMDGSIFSFFFGERMNLHLKMQGK